MPRIVASVAAAAGLSVASASGWGQTFSSFTINGTGSATGARFMSALTPGGVPIGAPPELGVAAFAVVPALGPTAPPSSALLAASLLSGSCIPPLLSTGTNPRWLVSFRDVGNLTAPLEFAAFSRSFAIDPADLPTIPTEPTLNGVVFVPDFTGFGCPEPSNPGSIPFRTDAVAPFEATLSITPPDGVSFDFAMLEAPAAWLLPGSGTPDPQARPGDPGYGNNATREIIGPAGPTGVDNTLPFSLPGLLPSEVFETSVGGVIIGAFANPGVERDAFDQSELRHLFTTGRLQTGENFVVVTRSTDSTTRIATALQIGVDPSWAVGENFGLPASTANTALGPDFLPANHRSNSRVRRALINHRLAVGFAPARNVFAGAVPLSGRAITATVSFDLNPGAPSALPTLADALAGDWQLIAPITITTDGDPLAESPFNGGVGLPNPTMLNTEAAIFINNLRSIADGYAATVGGAPSLFPQYRDLIPYQAFSRFSDVRGGAVTPSPNPDLNAAMQADVTAFILSTGVTTSLPTGPTSPTAGVVPTRTVTPGSAYSCGVPDGTHYIDQSGALVAYGAPLTARNTVAGDFNGDGTRNIDDVDEMVRAYNDRIGGPLWIPPNGVGPIAGAPGADAVIEILGDFTGDGNFDRDDLRYWADGLAVSAPSGTGPIDRRLAFTILDIAWIGETGSPNVFGTLLATGAVYSPGDSRLDIANAGSVTGAAPVARGFIPDGADGAAGIDDFDYIRLQNRSGDIDADGTADFTDVREAARFDFSADMDGDARVNECDVAEGFGVLATIPEDVNLDGVIDANDLAIVNAFLTTPTNLVSEGDVNGDGIVDATDLNRVSDPEDIPDDNNDGSVDFFDAASWFAAFSAGNADTDIVHPINGTPDACDAVTFILLLDFFS